MLLSSQMKLGPTCKPCQQGNPSSEMSHMSNFVKYSPVKVETVETIANIQSAVLVEVVVQLVLSAAKQRELLSVAVTQGAFVVPQAAA
jgi:hypothetical protein